MTRRTDRTADTLSRRLERAATIIPSIRDHLNEQRSNVTTMRAAGTDTGRSGSGGPSDPVGNLVASLAHIDELEGHIDTTLESIGFAVDLLDKDCRTALGHRSAADADRPGDTTPTAFELAGDPICWWSDCDQPVSSYERKDGSIGYRQQGDHGGLCDSHRALSRRQSEAA